MPGGVDTIVAIGGGSAIDTAKAASAATGLPLVSVPTTYSGAEWTPFFGVRDPDRRMRGGGAGANLHAIVYEPELTLGLPIPETVGTSLNALAHCAEALYVRERTPRQSDRDALEGARLIGEWLPQVVERPDDLEARTGLLRGACHAGAALGGSMLALGHALAGARRPLRRPARRAERAHAAGGAPLQRAGRRRGDRALRRGDRQRRSSRARRGARPPRRLRAPARPRHPRGRADEVAEAVAARPARRRTRVRSPLPTWRP